MNVSATIGMTRIGEIHPLPWSVAYDQMLPEWHPKSRPRVLDANGNTVSIPPSQVAHPGLYDIRADLACITIADAVNATAGLDRCPECGYTEHDCRTHLDHHLCPNHPYFSWEQS